MSIVLAAELLDTVGSCCRKFENECNRIKSELLELGRTYTSKVEDEEFYENLLMA
jgi:hypothetical protein